MDAEILEKYRKAGSILAEVLAEARTKVAADALLLDVADYVEGSIVARGGKPAFPCNISLDRAAAHYTPTPEDKLTFGGAWSSWTLAYTWMDTWPMPPSLSI